MIDKNLDKFIKTGKVKDYLDCKKKQKIDEEIAKELKPGDKNGVKRGDNC